jgi:hypothetical protein
MKIIQRWMWGVKTAVNKDAWFLWNDFSERLWVYPTGVDVARCLGRRSMLGVWAYTKILNVSIQQQIYQNGQIMKEQMLSYLRHVEAWCRLNQCYTKRASASLDDYSYVKKLLVVLPMFRPKSFFVVTFTVHSSLEERILPHWLAWCLSEVGHLCKPR